MLRCKRFGSYTRYISIHYGSHLPRMSSGVCLFSIIVCQPLLCSNNPGSPVILRFQSFEMTVNMAVAGMSGDEIVFQTSSDGRKSEYSFAFRCFFHPAIIASCEIECRRNRPSRYATLSMSQLPLQDRGCVNAPYLASVPCLPPRLATAQSYCQTVVLDLTSH